MLIPADYDIIIIRGAPGVGKSTLTKLLRKKYENGVTVEVDIVRGMINNVKWINKDEHIYALNATLAMSREYLNAGYKPIIITDTLGTSRMKQFTTMLKKLQIGDRTVSYITVSLFCTDKILEERIINRPDGFKDLDASRIINREMGKPVFPPEQLVDTSHRSPKDVLKVVADELGLE